MTCALVYLMRWSHLQGYVVQTESEFPSQKIIPEGENTETLLFTPILFVFESILFWFLCLSVPRQGSRRSSSRLSPLQVGVGVRRDRRECRESTGREPSCPPIAGDLFGPPAVAIPSPLAVCLVPGLPLPQAHRIAGDSSPPEYR